MVRDGPKTNFHGITKIMTVGKLVDSVAGNPTVDRMTGLIAT